MSDLMSLVSMGSVREKYNVRKLHGVCRCDVQVRGRVPQTCTLCKDSSCYLNDRRAKISMAITVWSD